MTWEEFIAKFPKPVGMKVKIQSQNGSAEWLLIGDVNEGGGLCDCCRVCGWGDQIVEYSE